MLAAAGDLGAGVVGRAGAGIGYLRLPGADPATVAALRARLAPSPCVVLDAPAALRAAIDPWDLPEGGALTLARRVRERFDPMRTLNPGLHVGGG